MKDGQILPGHCDCMASLGETCSHVASLIWVIATGVQRRDSLTVTDKSAYWVMPSAVKSVPHPETSHLLEKKETASWCVPLQDAHEGDLLPVQKRKHRLTCNQMKKKKCHS